MEKQLLKAEPFLDCKLISDLRNVINSSNIFYKSEKLVAHWNLLCTFMDRMDSAVSYLNSHSLQPASEEEFVFFMVYAAMVYDGIVMVFKKIIGRDPTVARHKKWFKDALNYNNPVFNEQNCPTDEDFFEYLRALSFAHPFGIDKRGANKRPFMEEKEIRYSPWVFAKGFFNRDCVGVRVYTDLNGKTIDTFIPFDSLKGFLEEWYSQTKSLTSWAHERIQEFEDQWKKRKVKTTGSGAEILQDILDILEERYVDDKWPFDEAFNFLTFRFHEGNEAALAKIASKIDEAIPAACICIDELDLETACIFLDFIGERPKGLHDSAYYELGKIFNYVPDENEFDQCDSDVYWGLEEARDFYDRYGSKYVTIDFNTFSGKEIKLLTRAACILGSLAEKEGK